MPGLLYGKPRRTCRNLDLDTAQQSGLTRWTQWTRRHFLCSELALYTWSSKQHSFHLLRAQLIIPLAMVVVVHLDTGSSWIQDCLFHLHVITQNRALSSAAETASRTSPTLSSAPDSTRSEANAAAISPTNSTPETSLFCSQPTHYDPSFCDKARQHGPVLLLAGSKALPGNTESALMKPLLPASTHATKNEQKMGTGVARWQPK